MTSSYRKAAPGLRTILCAAILIIASAPIVAHADPEVKTVKALSEKLKQRDDEIQDLQRRVADLERARDQKPPSTDAPKSVARTTVASQEITAPGAAPSKTLGQTEPDELAADRALERTLTENGALLLPSGVGEAQFNLTYSRIEQSAPTFVSQGGQLGVANIDSNRNNYTTGISARLGLPHDTQLELTLPYRVVNQTLAGPLGSAEMSQTQSSIGDLTIGIAKTLYREKDWLPDVIGRISWNAGTGNKALGDGYQRLRAGLTLLKRQDPLVFTGSIYYDTAFSDNHVKPGNQFEISLAALLAASPETSLSIGIDQIFSGKARVNGASVPGTEQVGSTMLFGVTSTVSKRVIVSLTAGVGLTKGAPNYFVNLSVPIRFQAF